MPPPTTIDQSKPNILQPIQPQPSQAPQGTTLSSHNTTSNPLPLTTQDYFFSSNNKIIRCPEGYVFEGSNSIVPFIEDVGVAKYNSSNQWLEPDGSSINTNPWSDPTFTCKRKFCEPLGIVNSDKEYHVIIDDTNNSSKTITCNDGYVFDTTATKMGKVKCGVIPIMNASDLDKDNEVAWIVDNPHAEMLCNSHNKKDDCENEKIPFKISKKDNEIYDTSSTSKKLKCTWVPPITSSQTGNDSGLARTPGKCKFIHRADFNDTEPICRSMLCGEKEVRNSNRIDAIDGKLPGPETGSIHGDCVNFDGQIIDNITNSSDCSCFKHKSCDVCTTDGNCQWCGWNPSSGEGGFCYSKKTHLDICRTSVHNDRGGTCSHIMTGEKKTTNKPADGWDKESCETKICVKENYWKKLSHGTEKIPNPTPYQTDKNSETSCKRDNNMWDDAAIRQAPDHCTLKNTGLDFLSSAGARSPFYYPKEDALNVKLNISEKICVPTSATPSTSVLQNCVSKTTKSDCDVQTDCRWTQNPLRDSLFNWSDEKKIRFRGKVPTTIAPTTTESVCPIIFDATTNPDINKKNELSFSIDLTQEPGYITLSGSKYNAGAVRSNNNYNNACSIIDIGLDKNIFGGVGCGNMGGTHHTEHEYCEAPGIKYCSINNVTKLPYTPTGTATAGSPATAGSTATINAGQPACPTGSTIDLGGRKVAGCLYHEQVSDAPTTPGYNCHSNIVDYECYPIASDPYNCDKSVPSSNNTSTNQLFCTNTLYTPVGSMENIKDKKLGNNKKFKNFITCNTNTSGGSPSDDKCNNIGPEYAHIGNFCKDSSNNKIPMKQICENSSLQTGSNWGKYIDANTTTSFNWGCYFDNGDKYSNDQICSLAGLPTTSTTDFENINDIPNNIISDGNIIILANTGTTDILKNDIVEQGNSRGIVIQNTPANSTKLALHVKSGTFNTTTDITIKKGVDNTNRTPANAAGVTPPTIPATANITHIINGVPQGSLIFTIPARTTATPSTPIIPVGGLPQGTTVTQGSATGTTVSYTPSGSTKINILKTSSADFTLTGSLTIASPALTITPSKLTKVLSTDTSSNKCIIDGVPNKTEPTEDDLKEMCQKTTNHVRGFKFSENNSGITIRGQCKKKDGTITDDVKDLTQDVCTAQNNIYEQHYHYNTVGMCDSIGTSRLKQEPDIPTTWTGGEISSSEDGIHKSECSPSIMSSCNADCKPGYGGGGEYICQYNNTGGDICDEIDKKDAVLTGSDTISKQELCTSHGACVYNQTTNKCSKNPDPSIKRDGHLEWIGSPCYKIDNTAFSHGIAKLPHLDKVIPPFVRVFLYMTVIVILITPIIIVFTKYLLKYVGKSIDFTINTPLRGVNKLIDAVTDSDKLIRIILSPEPRPAEKVMLLGGSIALFIGCYHLFRYFNEKIKDTIKTGIGHMSSGADNIKKNISESADTITETTPGSAACSTFSTQPTCPTNRCNWGSNICSEITSDERVQKMKDNDKVLFVMQIIGAAIVGIVIVLFLGRVDLIGIRTDSRKG